MCNFSAPYANSPDKIRAVKMPVITTRIRMVVLYRINYPKTYKEQSSYKKYYCGCPHDYPMVLIKDGRKQQYQNKCAHQQ